MLKRIISICTAMIISVMLCANVFAIVAQVDYSQEIKELQSLMEQCKNRGIPVDYEMVNYSVISRFEDYLNSDINNSELSDEALQYNIECMNELYIEAKENLTAYLSGTKIPLNVIRNDMDSFDYDGGVLNDKDGPLFSVGYGHFSEVMKTVPELNDFGADNIQIEVSPITFFGKNIKGWNVSYSGDVDAKVELIKDENTKLKIVNNSPKSANVYVSVSQTVSCMPSTTYKFGGDVKYLSDESFWISVNGFDNRNYISPASGSQPYEFTYTTSSTQTTMAFNIVLEVPGDLELDNIYIKKHNSSENILINGDFEWENSYVDNIDYLKETLRKAEQYNVGVNLLLSPHSFPTNLDKSLYHNSDYMFIKYNIDAPETRAVLKEYLDGMLPELKGYKALKSICLSNEPVYDTRKFADFYNPIFRDYLKEIHGTIDALNKAWGTTAWYNKYSDFSKISIKNVSFSLTRPAMGYDWIEFNDKIFADWHKWMADIVKKHLPDVPLHAKMMNYFDAEDDVVSDRYARGTDLELFAEFSDFAGNDAHNYFDDISTYYEMMFLYDYQSSVTNKPVYNSEEHIIEDDSSVFSEQQRKHWRNTLWQGMIHGRSMTSIWTWERILNSVLYRPDIAAETGKVSLDMMRVSEEISKIQQNSSDVALFYSKPSRYYQSNYSEKLFDVYEALLELGIKPAIVSDKSIEKIADYSVLIVPNAINCETETSEQVKRFCDNGGILIYSGDIFSKNKYNNALSNKYIYSTDYKFNVTGKAAIKEVFSQYFENLGMNKVKLIDKETGEMPDMIDWSYCINDNNILINITNLEFDKTKELSVIYDGSEIMGLECLLSGEIVDSVTAESYTPILLQYQIEKKDGKLSNLFVNKANSTINWQCNVPVNIYALSEDGSPVFIKKTSENQYTYTFVGNYIVTPITCDEISDGQIITIADNKPFDIRFLEVNKSDDYINCTIEIKNISNQFASSEFVLTAKNDGEMVSSSVYKVTLRSGTKTQYSISLPNSGEASYVELEAFDGYDRKNSCSNYIKYTF